MNGLLASDLPPDLHSRISPALVLAAFAISTVALLMVFASASWPLYVGLNADLPVVVNWVLAIAMLALTAATVAAATQLGENHRKFLELEGNTRLQASAHVSTSRP